MSYVGSNRYEEIKKKVNSGTYSGAAKTNSNTANSSTGTYKGSERYEAIKKKVNEQGYNSVVDDDYINSYIKDSEAFYKDADAAYRASGYMSAKSNYDLYRKKYSDLSIRKRNIEDYLDNAKKQEGFKSSEEFEKLYDYIKNDNSNMYDVVQQFGAKDAEMSKFSSQSEYLEAQKAARYREKLETADTDKASKDLADIDARIAEIEGKRKQAKDSYVGKHQDKANPESISPANLSISNPLGAPSASDTLTNQYTPSSDDYNAWKKQDDEYDKQIKELEKQRGEKFVYLNRAKNIQKSTKFEEEAMNSEDFDLYASTDDVGIESYSKQLEMSDSERFANNYLASLDGNSLLGTSNPLAAMDEANRVSKYAEMTDEQKKVYNYYRNKGETEKANEYLKSIDEELASLAGSAWAKDIENNVALEIAFRSVAGLDQYSSGIKDLFNTKDDYIAPSAWQVASSVVRENLADKGAIFGEGKPSLAQIASDLGATTVNMLPSILVSSVMGNILPAAGVSIKAAKAISEGVGAVTLGASAAGNAYAEMLNFGYSKGQARTYSALVGASEAGLQYALGGISSFGGKVSGNVIEKATTKLASALDTSIGKIAVEYGTEFAGNMFSEGLEESLQDVIEPAFKMLVFGDENAYDDFKLSDALYSGILGALSAGLLEGGGTISSAVQSVKASNLIGKAMQTEGFTDKLTSLGQTFSVDSVAYQLAGKVNENTTSYEMLQLLDSVNATLSEQNFNDIVEFMKQQNVPEEQARAVAMAVSNILAMSGEMITAESLDDLGQKTKAALDMNKPLQAALFRLIDPNSTINQKLSGRIESINSTLDTIDGITKTEDKPSKNKRSKDKSLPKSEQNASENVSEDKSIPETESASNGSTEEGKTNLEFTEILNSKDENGRRTHEAKVKNADGESVSLEDADISEDDIGYASAILSARSDYDAVTANELVSFAKKYNLAPSSFPDMDIEFNYGYRNQTGVSSASKEFSSKQISELRQIGKDARTRNSKPGITFKTTEGGAIDETGIDVKTKEQKADLEFVDTIASLVGGKVHIFASDKGSGTLTKDLVDTQGKVIAKAGKKSANGYHYSSNGEIFIDINAGDNFEGLVMYTLAHEYTHFIRNISPKAFNKLADVVVSELENGRANIEQLVQKEIDKAKGNGRDISYDEAYEDFIANALEKQLASNDTAYYLRNIYNADKNLFNHLKNKLREFYLSFKKMSKKYENVGYLSQSSASYEVSQLSKESLKKISNAYAEALKVAAGEYQNVELKKTETKAEKNTADSGVKYMVRYTENNTPVAVVEDDILNGVSKDKWVETVKSTLSNKFSNGIAIGGRLVKVNKISRSEFTNSKYTKYLEANDGTIYADKFKTANNLDDIVLASTNYINEDLKHSRKDNFVEFARGDVLLRIGGNDYTANVIIGLTSNNNMVLYDVIDFVKTNFKIKERISSSAMQKAGSERKTMPFNNKIPQDNSVVNSNSMQNSKNNAKELHSDRDSDGNTLTEEQMNYFKDSKVRDEDGNLLVVYHGTSEDFTVFDRTKSRANMDIQGNFFSPWELDAKGYGEKVKAYYLNIKNPAPEGIAYKALNKFKGQNNAGIKAREYLTSLGYDGVNNGNEEYIAFESNQSKLIDNQNPTSDKDIRFSLREPVEETKDLIAVHNLTEDKLLKSLSLGGLPMPSIAIMKAAQSNGNDGYGNISLVFGKDSIDPKFISKNKLYGGDAWTPTFPPIEYEVNEAAADILHSKYYELYKKYPQIARESLYDYVYDAERKLANAKGIENVISDLKSDTKMMRAFLADTENKVIPNIQKEVVAKLDEATREQYDFFIEKIGKDIILESKVPNGEAAFSFRHKYLDKYEALFKETYIDYLKSIGIEGEGVENVLNSIRKNELLNIVIGARNYINNGAEKVSMELDRTATDNAIKNAVDEKKYSDWLNSLFGNLEGRKGLRNQKDAYTKSGNMRSWSALHYELNLENVVEAMKEQNNGDVAIFTGMGLWGVAAKEYGTVSEMKADKSRLKEISDEEIKAIKEAYGDRFTEIALSLKDNSSNNEFIALDNAFTNILDAVRTKKTKSGVLSYLQTFYGNKVTVSTVDDILNLIVDVGNMPTRYFEAKPQRAVGFDEVKAIVIPNNASQELKSALQGYNVLEYNADEPSTRTDVLNSMDDLKFSERDFKKEIKNSIDNLAESDIIFLDKKEYRNVCSIVSQVHPEDITSEAEPHFNYVNSDKHKYRYAIQSDGRIVVVEKNPITSEIKERVDNNYGNYRASRQIDIQTKGYENRQRNVRMYNDISSDKETAGSSNGVADRASSSGIRGNNTDDGGNPVIDKVKRSERDSKLAETVKAIKEENAKLNKDKANLKELLDLQKVVTHGKIFTRPSLEKIAGSLRHKFNSIKSDKEMLVKELFGVYNYIADGKNITMEDIYDRSERAADMIFKGIKHKEEIPMENQEILNHIKSSKIYISEHIRKEVASQFGSYGSYRQRLMGRVNLVGEKTKGLPIDSWWVEASSMFPGVFDENINYMDMPYELFGIIERLKTSKSFDSEWFEYESEFIKQEIKNEIYDAYWEASTLVTVSDRYQKKLTLLKSKHAQQMEDVRTAHREKEAALKADSKEKRKQAVSDARESTAKRVEKDKLQKSVSDTIKWLTYPSKTETPCPDVLKKPFSDFLNSIDFSSKRKLNGGELTINDMKMINKFNSLANAIEKIQSGQDPNADPNPQDSLVVGYLDLPSDFTKDLKKIADNFTKFSEEVSGDYIVNRMTSEEVKLIRQIVKILKKSATDMSKIYNNARFANAAEMGRSTIKHSESLGNIKGSNAVRDFLLWHNATPYTAFNRMGEAGQSMFREFQDAQDRLAHLSDVIFDFTKNTYTDEEVINWSEDTHSIKLSNGNEIRLTTADAMSIYCLAKRQQAQGHLFGGGVRIIGKINKITKKKNSDSRSNLTVEDVQTIVDSLTVRQKKVADAIQRFMSTVCAEWGNEISMKRFLTKMFTEQNYFPIESNDEVMNDEDPSVKKNDMFRLLNISATKPLTKGANNEIVIRNIFEVFANHASDMSRLNAFAMPLLDFMKWFNYRERYETTDGQIKDTGVRKSLNKAFGDNGVAVNYLRQFIKDINGSESSKEIGFVMSMTKKAKVASVAANLRVALLQVTAFPRARIVLSDKALMYALHKKPQIEKSKKYCGIALWKSFGFYDIDISKNVETQIKGGGSTLDKIVDASLKLAEWGDSITWGALWNACEYDVMREQPNLKYDSEEFNQTVGLKLRDVVYSSQVVDSTLTRSQTMRNKSGLSKILTAFMSEPILSYNMLMDAAWKTYEQVRLTGSMKNALAKTGRNLTRAISAYMITQVLAALAEGLFDAYRDDDDDEFEEKFKKAFGQNLVQDMSVVGKIPVFKDVINMIQSKLGLGFFNTDRMDAEYLNAISDTIDIWKDIINNGDDSKYTIYAGIYKTSKALSNMTGLPVSNALREVSSLWNNTFGAADNTLKLRSYKVSGEEERKELFDSIKMGNKDGIDRLKKQISSYDSAVTMAFRENEPKIWEAAEARASGDIQKCVSIQKQLIAEYGTEYRDNIIKATNNDISKAESLAKEAKQAQTEGNNKAYKEAVKTLLDKYSEDFVTKLVGEIEIGEEDDAKYVKMFKSDDFISALKANDISMANEIKDEYITSCITDGKTEEQAEKAFKTMASGKIRDSVQSGDITINKAAEYLSIYCDKEPEDAEAQAEFWEFKSQNEELEYGWQVETYSSYIEDAKPYGISESVYDKYLMLKKACTGTDANGDGKTDSGSKKRAIMEVINSLPLTNAQKDVLYYQNGWSRKDIGKAPWH